MAAAATVRAGGSVAANCAVHIKISPQTLNVRESREVLRVLKDYGDVVSFRNFALIPPYAASHTILAVFQNSQAATKFKEASPLRLTVRKPPKSKKPVTSPSSFAPDLPSSTRHDDATQGPGKERTFLLTADTSNYSYLDHIRRQRPYWGYPSRHPSFGREDLGRPGSGVPAPGIADIDPWTTELPARVVSDNEQHVLNRQTRRLGWWKGEDIDVEALGRKQKEDEKERVANDIAMKKLAAKERRMAAGLDLDTSKTSDPSGSQEEHDISDEASANVTEDMTSSSPFTPTPAPLWRRTKFRDAPKVVDNDTADVLPTYHIDLRAQFQRLNDNSNTVPKAEPPAAQQPVLNQTGLQSQSTATVSEIGTRQDASVAVDTPSISPTDSSVPFTSQETVTAQKTNGDKNSRTIRKPSRRTITSPSNTDDVNTRDRSQIQDTISNTNAVASGETQSTTIMDSARLSTPWGTLAASMNKAQEANQTPTTSQSAPPPPTDRDANTDHSSKTPDTAPKHPTHASKTNFRRLTLPTGPFPHFRRLSRSREAEGAKGAPNLAQESRAAAGK